MRLNKYDLYEKSVQSPEIHVEWFKSMYRDVRNEEAKHLREDFCGSFQLCCEWVRQHPQNTALGLDLDPEPLAYGKSTHEARLSREQKKRLTLSQMDVLKPTSKRRKPHLIVACNFSFFTFKERKTLRQYFQSCLKSLQSKGLLILEVAGGPGMIEPMRERKTVRINRNQKFEYTWHQKSFNPISRTAHYGIHFKLPNGTVLKDSFTYDWRIWTIPEIRDLLEEVGFKKSTVYWETQFRGKATGEYAPTEEADNAYAWIAYIVGIK